MPVRPEVRAIHQAALTKGRSQAHANKRADLDAAARDLGHPDWITLIHDTAHLSVNQVARRVGRDPGTITYWRRKIFGENWATANARLQPRRAAAYARLDAEFAARGWSDLAAARATVGKRGLKGIAEDIGSSPATLLAWDTHRRPDTPERRM